MNRIFDIRQVIFCGFLLFLSCKNREGNANAAQTNAATVVYDEAGLKNLVLSTKSNSEQQSLTLFDSVLKNAAPDSNIFCKTVSFLENPVSDPNSMFRNEKLYVKLLEEKINSKWYSEEEKEVFRNHIHLAMQNDAGDTANDFAYILPNGDRKKMYGITADYTLLFFNNPECPACKDMKTALIQSPVISQHIASGKLKVLSVYTDTDLDLWKKYLPEMPSDWIVSHDENGYLFNNNIYDLKAIPTVYLLDRNKKVLLKDCMDVSAIEKQLSNNKQQ